MSLKITEECISCDACREECPNEAIEADDPFYMIDSDMCTECVGSYDEPNCISVCPVDAITLDDDNIETIEELKYKFEQLKRSE